MPAHAGACPKDLLGCFFTVIIIINATSVAANSGIFVNTNGNGIIPAPLMIYVSITVQCVDYGKIGHCMGNDFVIVVHEAKNSVPRKLIHEVYFSKHHV